VKSYADTGNPYVFQENWMGI